MIKNKPLSRERYLCSMYALELTYINKIISFQDYHFESNGEIVILLDRDFPNFNTFDEKKMKEIIFLYEKKGWTVRKETVKDRKEILLILS
jgi:hypothetical protein